MVDLNKINIKFGTSGLRGLSSDFSPVVAHILHLHKQKNDPNRPYGMIECLIRMKKKKAGGGGGGGGG
ncbi:hypothetical protein, partial [Escherichia coli]|uniref:hypothetical protein n=1 Tax=Escherichia coli TaxID=562 RepID=UPI001A7E10D5